ncbi:MAG: SPOR domain-containing protein [Cyclobacteriaceae bacterium]|nr:SPOR domain-containing protein [Cyclobacteriaceae bacterium]
MNYFVDMEELINRTAWSCMMFVVCLASFSCAAQKNSSKPYYHEDLQALRPKFPETVDSSVQIQFQKKEEVVPVYNVNKKVDGVLDSINHFNASRKLIDGFTIQIYSGQNREEAMLTKKKMSTDAGDLSSEMEYTQPKFRVKVGSYFSRLEAQKDLLRMKRLFPNAILVPEKILVR